MQVSPQNYWKCLEILLLLYTWFAYFYFRPNKGREQLSLEEKETLSFLKQLLSNF